ncbi:GFA family protein [Phreatobacter stygius]|nr:GFA family protein [Phreatobacter stygius]
MKIACHCGGYQARLAKPPNRLINCHCGFCRSLGGAAFTTWATVPVVDLTVECTGELRSYRASENAIGVFCATCGTHVHSEDRRLPGKIGIPAGIITGALPPPSAHYFTDHKADWFSISDALPCFGGETGFAPKVTA